MKQVLVPNLGYVNFPDEWSDQQIQAHLEEHAPRWLQPDTTQQPSQDSGTPPTPEGFLPNLSAGFRQAAGPGNLAIYSAAAASAADALGYPDTRDTLLQYSGDRAKDVQAIPVAPSQFSSLHIDPQTGERDLLGLPGRARDWMGASVGQAAGSTLVPLGGALTGAALGGVLAGPPGAGIGALLGGGLAAQQMGAGDVYSEIAQSGSPVGQGLRAQAWGIPYGAAEIALGPEGAALAKWALPALRSNILSPTVKQGLVRTALKSAGQEAVANPLQEMMVMEAAREARGDPLESIMTMENGWRVLDAAASGAVGGAALGGVVGALPSRQSQTPTQPPPEPSPQTPTPPEEPLQPLVQDNVNQNPYGAANENVYTMQAGPLGAVRADSPFTQVTPPVYPEEDNFTPPVEVTLPKSRGNPRIVPAAQNLAEARRVAQALLSKGNKTNAQTKRQPEKSEQPTKTAASPSAKAPVNDQPAKAEPPQGTPLAEATEVDQTSKPRYVVKPVGKKGEESYNVIDTTRKPRSKGWVWAAGLSDPASAQQIADSLNSTTNQPTQTSPQVEPAAPRTPEAPPVSPASTQETVPETSVNPQTSDQTDSTPTPVVGETQGTLTEQPQEAATSTVPSTITPPVSPEAQPLADSTGPVTTPPESVTPVPQGDQPLAQTSNQSEGPSEELPKPKSIKVGKADITPLEGTAPDGTETDNEIYKSLRKSLDDIGLSDVGLRVAPVLIDVKTGGPEVGTPGRYVDSKSKIPSFRKIIEIATHPSIGKGMTPREAFNHEVWHALKDVGAITPEEWAHLNEFAAKEWHSKYKIGERYKGLLHDDQMEEAIAEAGREYLTGKDNSFDTPTKKIFNKVKRFLQAIKNWWDGLGFTTPDELFETILTRTAKERKPSKAELRGGFLPQEVVTQQAESLPKYLRPQLQKIADASEVLLGNPDKIGPIRKGVYSGWVNKAREVIQTARGLSAVNPYAAALYTKSSLRHSTTKAILDNYLQAAHEGMMNKAVSPATQNKVFAAIELWDWKGERPDINGPLAVKNDLHDLDHSKFGEEIILRTPEELNALRATRRATDLMLTQMKHAVLRNLGLEDVNITPQDAKARYEDLKEQQKALPKGQRGELSPEVERWRKITSELVDFDRLLKTSYMPRIRFGNAGVAVYKKKDPSKGSEPDNLELYDFQQIEGLDTKTKAYLRAPKVQKMINDLKGKYKEADGFKVSNSAFAVTHNTIAELIRQRANTNTQNPFHAILDNIPTILGMLTNQQLETLKEGDVRTVQDYLNSQLTTGTVAKHMLHAKKILGSNTEVPRVLGQYGLSMASGIAKMQTAPMERAALATIYQTNDVKLIRWAQNYMDYMDNPAEEWNKLKSLGFTWNLGFNVASAALNFANIATMYGPYVSQWTKAGDVSRSFKESIKTSGKILKHTYDIVKGGGFDALPNPELAIAINEDLVKKGIIDKGLYDYLNALNKEGVLDHGLSLEQLGAQPEYGSTLPEHKVGRLYQKGVNAAGKMFRWSEAMARLSAAISLYDVMKNPDFKKKFLESEGDKYVWQGESGGDPIKGEAGEYNTTNVARYVLKNTFGDYDKANRPAFMKGFWGVVNQFSQYPVMMMETMFQHMSPFKKAQDARTLAKMLGVAFALSGLSGFAPMSDDMKRILENLYKMATGQHINMEQALLEVMVERAGIDPGLARDIMYGPYRAIPGIEQLPLVGQADIGKRVALNTVPAIDTMLNIFAGNAQMSPVTGPAGIAARVSDTWDAYHRGTPYAFTNLIPTAFHNASQGFFEWADTGVRNRYNNVVIDPAADGPLALSASDYATKVIGFNPIKVQEARLMDRFERTMNEGTKEAKARWRSKIMIAYQQQRIAAQRGDEERYAAAAQQIRDYMQEILERDRGLPPTQQIGIKPKDLARIRKDALDGMGTALKTERRTAKPKRPEVESMRSTLFGDLLPPL